MRGLTAWEKHILLRMANDPPDFIRKVNDEPMEYWAARYQLLKDGRLQNRNTHRADGTPTVVADITPKGREALRLDAIISMAFA